jgi:hypothetical protein
MADNCKPCWELKYCPYGPLAEQSPLLPQDRSSAVEHNEYLRQVVATGKTGSIDTIDDGERKSLKRILADDDMLLRRALHKVRDELRIRACEQSEGPLAAFAESFSGDLPPIEEYRVSFKVISDSPIDPDDQALIAHQQLQIEKLRRELYGPRSERTSRILDQIELQFDPVMRLMAPVNQ